LKDTKAAIGSIAFWRLLKQHRRAEIGYHLNAAYWKRGYMQEAMEAVIRYGFQTLHLHSVEANITPGNEASQSLLLRNGFVREGFFKENYMGVAGFLDTASFSLITK
jgi:ribosomal-protein-alanine N-acetyltransferase